MWMMRHDLLRQPDRKRGSERVGEMTYESNYVLRSRL